MRERRPQAAVAPGRQGKAMDDLTLTAGAALLEGRRVLARRAGPDARWEALFLLAGVMDTTLGRAALERERVLGPAEVATYRERLARRAAGEPLQYIEGRAAFRALDLRIDRSVLIPRPETEELVERVLDWAAGRERLRALDLGTGSGAIAISLVREGPFVSAVGVDISAAALNVARDNAATSGVGGRVDLREGSLFDALRPDERFHVIVSNPPYVACAEADTLPDEVRDWEPQLALYAGPTGLEVIEAIVRGAGPFMEPGGLLALEVAPQVARRACELVESARTYSEPRLGRDLAGRQRFILAERSVD